MPEFVIDPAAMCIAGGPMLTRLQLLADATPMLPQYGLTEKRRGIATIIKSGADAVHPELQQGEFATYECQQILLLIQRLELGPAKLLSQGE